MPKSRGRKRAKSIRPRTPAPVTWQADVLARTRPLLRPETSRHDVELLASRLLGETGKGTGTARLCSLDTWVRDMFRYVERRRTPEAAAFALALNTVRPAVDSDDLAWARELLKDLTWTHSAALRPRAVWRAPDPWEDRCTWLLEYDDHVLAVRTRRCGLIRVTGIELLPREALTRADAQTSDKARSGQRWVHVCVDDGLAALKRISALPRQLQWWNASDEQRLGHLLDARVREAADRPRVLTVGATRRDGLLTAFCEDVGLRDMSSLGRIAELWFDFAQEYMDGDPLLWNPGLVDEFLLEWMPYEAIHHLELLPVVPAFTYQWVLWALLRRGLTLGQALEAAVVAVRSAELFRTLCEQELEELAYQPDELPFAWQKRAS